MFWTVSHSTRCHAWNPVPSSYSVRWPNPAVAEVDPVSLLAKPRHVQTHIKYTRYTRFLFQQRPSNRSLAKHFQNPRHPCRVTMALRALITSASRSDARPAFCNTPPTTGQQSDKSEVIDNMVCTNCSITSHLADGVRIFGLTSLIAVFSCVRSAYMRLNLTFSASSSHKFGHLHARVLALPLVVRGIANTVLATQLSHRHASLAIFQSTAMIWLFVNLLLFMETSHIRRFRNSTDLCVYL